MFVCGFGGWVGGGGKESAGSCYDNGHGSGHTEVEGHGDGLIREKRDGPSLFF